MGLHIQFNTNTKNLYAPQSLGGIFARTYCPRPRLVDLARHTRNDGSQVLNLRRLPQVLCLTQPKLNAWYHRAGYPVHHCWEAVPIRRLANKLKRSTLELNRELHFIYHYLQLAPKLAYSALLVAILTFLAPPFLVHASPTADNTRSLMTFDSFTTEPTVAQIITNGMTQFSLFVAKTEKQQISAAQPVSLPPPPLEHFNTFADSAMPEVAAMDNKDVASSDYFKQHRPDETWLDNVVHKSLSPLYAPTAIPWTDSNGRVERIEGGFVIMKIPAHMAPMYEYVEHVYGVSRYVLMAVATIESKQGLSMVSPTNCQGWGNFCPGTISLFEHKFLLPNDFNTYDTYDGIAGIAVHLWVSSLGVRNYLQTIDNLYATQTTNWPVFWSGETPDLSLFEAHSTQYHIIPACWGYNRSTFYGYSVAKLARFYQDHDKL